MLKRLIEVALPLKEVSEQSAREKSIRHGHISTLHIWWARRPLAACRAIVFASLIPDPDNPECPEEFRTLVKEILSRNEFKPKDGNGSSVEDTPRNRCLEFIKYLVRWENSNKPEYIEPARKLIAAAHKFLHPDSDSDAPKVLDPFAGGGAIPLESLRLGCEAHAIELNPVAHLIELCTLVYPQKYGQPDSRPVPDYIKRLVAHSRAKRRAKGEMDLFDKDSPTNVDAEESEIIPDVEITEEEYRSNPLAADVKYWGNWIAAKVFESIGHFYPSPPDGSTPVAYLWARTVICPNPSCKATIPLILQTWLCKKADRHVALRLVPHSPTTQCLFEVVEDSDIDFDPQLGTMKRGTASCPFCNQIVTTDYIKGESKAGRMGQQMTTVITVKQGVTGKSYNVVTSKDIEIFDESKEALRVLIDASPPNEPSLIPDETISKNARGQISPPIYGIDEWGKLFNPRQLLAMVSFLSETKNAIAEVRSHHDDDYGSAVGSYLGVCVSRLADFNSSLCTLNNVGGRGVAHTFTRQSLPMVWDYAESAPFNPQGANWSACVAAATGVITRLEMKNPASVVHGSSMNIPLTDTSVELIVTDPPYYDAVPYSDLSDFFFVWQKRVLGEVHPDLYRTPLSPKSQEIIQAAQRHGGDRKVAARAYEDMMAKVFDECYRVLSNDSIVCVMFAHKTTAAWETLVAALLKSGLSITGSWPLRTEKPGRTTAIGTAALASSVTLVCRKRTVNAGDGLWDDVRQELKDVAKERLDFFWDQRIRGADFFISAIGPALSVYGRYARVIRLSGEEVTVGEFLDEVRSLVTGYALTKILHTTNTANIDSESRFYVVWKWSYGDAKVPADESFKLAQALGIDTEEMWDKTGVLTKSGENVQCLPVEKRMKVKDLGEPDADGTPASLIDVLHRMCVFRDKDDSAGMAQFLGHSGQARNPALWLVAQAISETLPDGNKEKQLMQGLLNQQEGLEESTRQKEFDLKG